MQSNQTRMYLRIVHIMHQANAYLYLGMQLKHKVEKSYVWTERTLLFLTFSAYVLILLNFTFNLSHISYIIIIEIFLNLICFTQVLNLTLILSIIVGLYCTVLAVLCSKQSAGPKAGEISLPASCLVANISFVPCLHFNKSFLMIMQKHDMAQHNNPNQIRTYSSSSSCYNATEN